MTIFEDEPYLKFDINAVEARPFIYLKFDINAVEARPPRSTAPSAAPPFSLNMANLHSSFTIAKSSRARLPLNALALMANGPAEYDDYCKRIDW